MTGRTGLRRRALAAFAATAATCMLAACGDGTEGAAEEATTEVSNETLAAVVSDADGFSVASDVMGDAGLAQVFDGAAAYTIFIPQDDVFDSLGEAGSELRSPEQRPAMVAILRDHIVPGYLTPEDIANAIELDEDGSVAMQTMGDHTLTFTAEGDTITVASQDGATARMVGDAMRASNGVAIPLDGLLKQVEQPGG